jgi:hypothetical protein
MKELIIPIVELLANWHILTPIRVAKLRYMYIMHKWPHFEHPTDLNEKINYLKFYGDTSKWPMLTDKYAVRKYIESIGLGDTLVKLYGKWDSVEDIDWNSLPDKFVMKCNNGSGDVLICKDKANLDIEATKRYFDKMLHREFGVVSGEPHYAQIKPCIIAEELLDASTQPCGSSSLVDYKIWCFNGKAHSLFCCYNRKQYHANVGVYDLSWHYHPEASIFTKHYIMGQQLLPKPICLDKMIELAEKLSVGFPILRVDLYEVNGHVYFGELTFTSQSGCMDYFSKKFLNETGALINLN